MPFARVAVGTPLSLQDKHGLQVLQTDHAATEETLVRVCIWRVRRKLY